MLIMEWLNWKSYTKDLFFTFLDMHSTSTHSYSGLGKHLNHVFANNLFKCFHHLQINDARPSASLYLGLLGLIFSFCSHIQPNEILKSVYFQIPCMVYQMLLCFNDVTSIPWKSQPYNEKSLCLWFLLC